MSKINTLETLWESPGKNHEDKPFFTVKQSRGYYVFGERVGRDSICFILFDNKTKKFGLISESKPPMDTETELCRMTTAFGGSIDMGENTTYQEICQTEVLEEAGYVVPLDRITSIGKTLVSTQMSQMAEGFLVNITDIPKTEKAEYEMSKDGDTNDEFSGNSVIWMDSNELMENNDWKSIFIWTKSVYEDIITKD